MYEQFYGLKDKPFSMLPDPGFLYLSKKHQAALTLLEYGLMNNVGFCVISGETGAGKTTVLRTLLNRIDDSYRVGMITNTHQSFGSLLDWVLSAFNQHEKGLSHVEMHQKLMDYLISEYSKNRKVLLVVDEAQNMNAETLEELRMLSNVNSEKDQLMQVILAGQPALKDTLRIPELMQFAQRIGVDYHLGDLDVSETTNYIQHRLRTAGATHDIFTAAACARIHSYSGGTPRLVNLLCDTVMVYGFADQVESIDINLVDEMVQERMKDSVVPLVNRDSPTNYSEEELAKLEKDFPSIKEQIDKEMAAKEAMAREDALIAATQAKDNASDEKDERIKTSSKTPAETVSGAQNNDANSADVDQQVVNKVEVIQQEVEQESDHWWLYGIIIVLLGLIIFFVVRSDLVLSFDSSNTPVHTDARTEVTPAVNPFIGDKKLTQADKQKQKALSVKAAQQEKARIAAEASDKAAQAVVREQKIAEKKTALAEQKRRKEAEKSRAEKAKRDAQRIARLADEKRMEQAALEAKLIEQKKLAAQRQQAKKLEAQKVEAARLDSKKRETQKRETQTQQALREQEKAALLAQQKLEAQRLEDLAAKKKQKSR